MKRLLAIIFFITLSLIPSAKSDAATLRTPSTLASGLIGWWTFDGEDIVGGRLRDRSASGNNGSLINIATSTFYAEGKLGQAGKFDGTNDYAQLGTIGALSRLTISAWIKRTGGFGTSDQQRIIMSDSLGTSFGFYIQGTNRLELGQPGTGGVQATSGAITDTNWHHVAVSYNGSNATFYVDGVAVGSPAYAVSFSSNTYSLARAAYGGFLHGYLDDVRVYNRALTAGEITQLYRYGSAKIAESKSPGSLSSGLLAHWTFDGADMWGGVVRDISGNNRHAFLSGIATTTFYSAGRVGQSGYLDSSNDFATTTLFISPADYPSLSISAWVRPDTPSSAGFRAAVAGDNGGFDRAVGVDATTGLYELQVGNTAWNPGPAYQSGRWDHIVAVYEPSAITFYLNGTSYSYGSGGTFGTSNQPLLIGADLVCGATCYWKGNIDDVRVYSRALTAVEVGRLYDLGVVNKTSATTQNKSSLSTGLVSHWTFDGKDTWGGVLRDRIGDHNAQLVNIASSTFYGAGIIGQAGHFDGSNDFATTSAHSILNGASQLTIAGWANMRTTTSRGSIFSRWTSASNWLSLQFSTGNDVNLIVGNGGTTYGTFDTGVGATPPRMQWNHYAMVFDGSQTGNANRLKAYVNGESVTLSFTGTIPATAPTMTNNDRIGYDTHNDLTLDGAADDVRVYSRALSQDEIKALYRMGR